MLEKSSINTKCKYCSSPATSEVAGIPVCAKCKNCEDLKNDKKVLDAFKPQDKVNND